MRGWTVSPDEKSIVENVIEANDWCAVFVCTKGAVHRSRLGLGYWNNHKKTPVVDTQRSKKTFETDEYGYCRCTIPSSRLLIRKKIGGGATNSQQQSWDGAISPGSKRFENGTIIGGKKSPNPGYVPMVNANKVTHLVHVNDDHGTTRAYLLYSSDLRAQCVVRYVEVYDGIITINAIYRRFFHSKLDTMMLIVVDRSRGFHCVLASRRSRCPIYWICGIGHR